MIKGAHFLLYSTQADADREFIRGVLGFPSIDAGGGWLIFKVPPSEMAVHPDEETLTKTHGPIPMAAAVMYLICDNLEQTMKDLAAKGVTAGRVGQAEWGRFTSIPLPSGAHLGLYQPSHPMAI